jgi:signal transduction histidine kinase
MNQTQIKSVSLSLAISVATALLVFIFWTFGGTLYLMIQQTLNQRNYLPVYLQAFIVFSVAVGTAFLIEKFHFRKILKHLIWVLIVWCFAMVVLGNLFNYSVLFIPGSLTIIITAALVHLKNILQFDMILSKKLTDLTNSGHSLERIQSDLRVESCLKLVETILPLSETVVFKLDKKGKLSEVGRSKKDSVSSSSLLRQNKWSEVLDFCENALKSNNSLVQIEDETLKKAKLAIPLVDDNKPVGVLFVSVKQNFEREDESLLKSFSEQLARNFHRQEMRKKNLSGNSWMSSLSTQAIKIRTENISLIRGLMKEQSFAGLAMSQTPLAHAVFYLDGTPAYINRQMRKILGLKSVQSHEFDLLSLLQGFKTEIFNDPTIAIKRVLQTGEPYNCELDFQKSSKFFDLSITLIKASDNDESAIHETEVLTKPVCVVVSVKDITAIKENEQLRSDMASLMSHELRTPITSIKGFSELLLLDDKIPAESKEFLNIISNESQRLSNMLTTFLSVSKLEQSDKKEFHKTAVKVDSVVHEVVEQMQDVARKKRIRLVENNTAKLPPVAADKSLLMKAILNLIDNAIRYSPEKTSVMVSTMMEAEVLRVVVEDRGYGIPNDQLDSIWQKFYRVEREGLDKQEETTGLGLSFVKEIVEKHGGKVRVDSKVGFGSRFSLTLPRL